MTLQTKRTKGQIEAEIFLVKIRLDSIEESLQAEPWNFALRQNFKDTQAELNNLIAESVNA